MNKVKIPDEVIIQKIYEIRNQKVMIDRDLAELYGVQTKVLKQAVNRNTMRFPIDFMFPMNTKEFENWRSQFVTSNSDKQGLRHAPYCFTESGVKMLSCVLNSPRAIGMNIKIIRIFIKFRELIINQKDILSKIEKIERKTADQGQEIKLLFEYLKELMADKESRDFQAKRKRIGF